MNEAKLEELLATKLINAHDNWKTLCPFHSENSPSFFIHKTDYICHCFGCGIGGYLDILLAKKQQVPTSQIRKSLEITAEDIGFDRTGHRVEWHKQQIISESWLSLWKRIKSSPYLRSRGFNDSIVQAAGARYDKATSRIVFPIRDFDGKLVGAAGRSDLNADTKWFFYWNAHKGNYLYMLPGVLDKRDYLDPLYVTEGILDALWLTQHGYKDAVAIMGSHTTLEQIKQIKRIANNVVLCLDNDRAGKEGARKLENMLKDSCNVQYAFIPEHANDVCDLSDVELEWMFKRTYTPLEYHAGTI